MRTAAAILALFIVAVVINHFIPPMSRYDWSLWMNATRILALMLLIGGLYAVVRERLQPDDKPKAPPPPSTYGTAAFAEMQITPPCLDASHGGAFLGQSCTAPPPGQPVRECGGPVFTTPDHHTLIVASTRTGKGTRVIIPTLLRYRGSLFVIDPKGENAAVTARARQAFGQTVHILNPWGHLAQVYAKLGFAAATYNPLDALDRQDKNAVAVAQSFANAICLSDAPDHPFFQSSAATLLTAILLYLADDPLEQKTLARVRQIVGMPENEFRKKILVKMIASSAFGGAISAKTGQFEGMAKETYSGVISNLNRYTSFVDDPQLKAATSASSFKMLDVAMYPTSVYVVIPTERVHDQKTWLRLLITALTQTYKDFANLLPHLSAPLRPRICMALIDELPALGKLPDLPRDIATILGYNMHYVLVVQGLDQLRDVYGSAAGTILNNCTCQWYCNVRDLESARTISEQLGDKTITTKTAATSLSSAQSGQSTSASTTTGEAARRLLQPSEVLQLGRNVAIAFMPQGKPMYLRPVDYWELHATFAPYRQNFPLLFWDPPLAPDANPYAPRP